MSLSCSEPKQKKLAGVVVRHTQCSREKISVINELVLGFIERGQRPISIVEDDVFVDLLAYLEPGYSCPGRTYFTDAIMLQG